MKTSTIGVQIKVVKTTQLHPDSFSKRNKGSDKVRRIRFERVYIDACRNVKRTLPRFATHAPLIR